MILNFIRRIVRKLRRLRRPIMSFQVKLTDHCNLNCIGCNVYAPVSAKSYLDIDAYRRDITRMSKLFGNRCDVILSGGEPLLHPDIVNVLQTTRQALPKAKLSLLTNGTLVLKQKPGFWSAMRESNIGMQVTSYPIDTDYQGIFAKCAEQGVACEWNLSDEPKDTFLMQALNPKGTGDPVKNYSCCSVRYCRFLSDGKLFPCMVITSIGVFNKHFGYELPVAEDDYVDIYKVRRPRRIIRTLYPEYRRKPFPFCSYCDIDSKLVSCVDFRRSNKDIGEWVNLDKVEL